jgi:hypothetical protein
MRNYPVTGRLRWIFEGIRPQIRQYFIESNIDGTPFSHNQRSLVYERAKNLHTEEPFGTERDASMPPATSISFIPLRRSARPKSLFESPSVGRDASALILWHFSTSRR